MYSPTVHGVGAVGAHGGVGRSGARSGGRGGVRGGACGCERSRRGCRCSRRRCCCCFGGDGALARRGPPRGGARSSHRTTRRRYNGWGGAGGGAEWREGRSVVVARVCISLLLFIPIFQHFKTTSFNPAACGCGSLDTEAARTLQAHIIGTCPHDAPISDSWRERINCTCDPKLCCTS